MKKTCKYCGVVPFDHVCPYRKKHAKNYHKPSANGEIEKFRNSSRWQRKRELIKERDLYLCVVCRSGLYGEIRYNSEDLEVHHIVPLDEDFDLALDDDNLVTICCRHHKLADAGKIPREVLRRLTPPG